MREYNERKPCVKLTQVKPRDSSVIKQETKKLLFGGIQHATYHISAKMSRNRGYEIAAETGKKELASSSFSLCVFQMQNAA
jgi:hypothetical protein